MYFSRFNESNCFVELAIYKCVFDILFVQQYLWLPFINSHYFYRDETNSAPYYCNASLLGAVLSFVSQFALLGSVLCFLIISVDLRIAYTNPFSSFQQNRLYYAIFVLGISILVAVILILCGPQVYGLASEGIVWIQTKRIYKNSNYYSSPNYPKFLFLYFPEILVYIYCLWANFQYYRSATAGLAQTLSNRVIIMQRSKRYTLSFVAYDIITLFLEFISFVNYYNYESVNSLPSYFYSLRGFASLFIILYANSQDLKWIDLNPFWTTQQREEELLALEGLLMQPHLNAALRVELLYFTTKGIMHAAKDFDDMMKLELQQQQFMGRSSNTKNHNTAANNNNNNMMDDGDEYKEKESIRESEYHSTMDADEARCYSFDEHPYLGIRPSLLFEETTNGTTGRSSKRLSKPFLQTPAATTEEYGVALQDTSLNNTISSSSSMASSSANPTTIQTTRSSLTAAELNKLQTQQKLAVTYEVERALLEVRGSHMSLSNQDILQLTQSHQANMNNMLPPTGSISRRSSKRSSSVKKKAGFFSLRRFFTSSIETNKKKPAALYGSSMSSQMHGNNLSSSSTSNPLLPPVNKDVEDVEFSMRPEQSTVVPSSSVIGSTTLSTSQHTVSPVTPALLHSHNQQYPSKLTSIDYSGNVELDDIGRPKPSVASGASAVYEPAWQRVTIADSTNSNHPTISVSNAPSNAAPSTNQQSYHISFFQRRNTSDSSEEENNMNQTRGNKSKNNRDTEASNIDEEAAVRSVSSNTSTSTRDLIIRVMQSMIYSASQAAQSVLSPAYREFRFKDFMPRLFARIRKIHNINVDEYARAFEATCREKFSEGRSGAFMFYSSNQRYIVKSTTKEDLSALRDIMPSYTSYLADQPNSLLVRFLGAHCMTMYGVDIYFTVMLNLFPVDKMITERYDLKGSWVNRYAILIHSYNDNADYV
jgi:hypothetical protein